MLLLSFSLVVSIAFFFLIFSLLEFCPAITKCRCLSSIRYYSLKERYIFDEELVFRQRPFWKIETSEFKGGEYSSSYGVEVPSMTYKASCDEDGFRTPNVTQLSDIVIIGDSFIAMGYDESDTFSERLRRVSGLRTTNLGIGGYGPFQYLTVLKKYGIRRKPRYALFCFFEGNDIVDIRHYINWKKGGSYHDFMPRNFLRRYSMVLQDIFSLVEKNLICKFRQKFTENSQNQKEINPELVELDIGDKAIKTVFSYKGDARLPKELLNTNEYLELKKILIEFKKICIENSIIPIVLFIPTKTHIYAKYSTEKSGRDWLKIRDGQIFVRQNIEIATSRLCEDVGVKLISLTPVFESLAKEGKFLYSPFDSHWDSEAREVAAMLVAKELKLKFEE